MNRSEQTTTGETAATLISRATGVLFFAGFGSIWLFNGLETIHRVDGMGVAAILTIAALLIVPALRLLRTASKASSAIPASPAAIARKREFRRINTTQWIAIAAAIVLFNLLHRTEFLAPVIAFIVGMHLFPLATLFRCPAHNVTGTLLVLWSTAIVTLLADADLPSAGAIGAAVILLGSAMYMLVGAYREAKGAIVPGMKYSAVA